MEGNLKIHELDLSGSGKRRVPAPFGNGDEFCGQLIHCQRVNKSVLYGISAIYGL
jgi:hypothetical protein